METEKITTNGCAELSQVRNDVKESTAAPKQTAVQMGKLEREAEKKSDPPLEKKSDPLPQEKTDPPHEKRSDPPLEKRSDPPHEKRSDPPHEKKSDPPLEKKSDPAPSECPSGALNAAAPIIASNSTSSKVANVKPVKNLVTQPKKPPLKKSPIGGHSHRRATRNSPNGNANSAAFTTNHNPEPGVTLPVAHKSSPEITQPNQNTNGNWTKSSKTQKGINGQPSTPTKENSNFLPSQAQKNDSPAKVKRKRLKNKSISPSRLSDEPRASKRVRLQYQPFQSPESMGLAPTFFRHSQHTKNAEDKIVVFNRGDFLAVRNESGSFYICRTAQNVYKTSRKFKIQWLNDEKDPNVYIPDFYDQTDFECVLTNLRMVRLDKRKYRLPDAERQRVMNILERALNVERGVSQVPDPKQVVMDGVDVSIVGKAEEEELIKISPKIAVKNESKPNKVGRPKKKLKEKTAGEETENRAKLVKPPKKLPKNLVEDVSPNNRRTTRSSISVNSVSPISRTPKVSPQSKRGGLDSVVRKLRSKARISNQTKPVSVDNVSPKSPRNVPQKRKKSSPNRKSYTGLTEGRKQKSSVTLQPKPHVTFYERDPTFELLYGELPYISSLAHSRLLIRAVLLKDYELLERLMTEGKVCTFCATRCLSIKRDAISYAIEREDLDAIKMLMDCKYGNNFAAFPEVIIVGNNEPSDGSSFSESIKCTTSRPNRDQPNMLLKDLNTDYRCQRQKLNITREIVREALRFGVSKPFIEGLINVNHARKDSALVLLLSNVVTAMRFGHNKLTSELIEIALQKGGYGFTSLHRDALVLTEGAVPSCKGILAKKRTLGNAKILPVHCAALNPTGHVLAILLQRNHSDLNQQDSDGWQPVHYAAVCRTSVPLEILISKGTSTVQTENEGNTPLHLACITAATHNVELILSHEANTSSDDHAGSCIEKLNKAGCTPLHVAIERGTTDIVAVLLQSGADAEKPTGAATDKLTPLMLAAQFGHIQIVKMLIEKGVDIEAVDKRQRTALVHAVMNGHATIVSYLLRLGVNPDVKDVGGNTAVHYAVAYGWYYCFKLLLEAPSKLDEPNHCRVTPMVTAFLKGHMGIVELLSEKGVDINAHFRYSNGVTLLMEAVRSKPSSLLLERVKLLVESQNTDCKKVDDFGNNALHYLVKSEIENNNYWKSVDEGNNEEDDVCGLEDEEVCAQKQEETYMRTRQKEVKRIQQNSLYEAAKILIEHGCDPKAANKNGESALSLAAKHGCFSLMKRFVEAGCRITFTTNEDGNTILHLIVANVLQDGAAEFLYMMSKEASPMASLKEMAKTYNNEGKTPLMLALSKDISEADDCDKKKFIEFVRYLVEVLHSNVDAFVKGDAVATETCLHIAAKFCRSTEILLILLKHTSIVDPLNSKGQTPLVTAIVNGNDEAARLLIAASANLNFKVDFQGKKNILLLAAALGRTSLVPLIISKGANITELDSANGNSVLHYLVKYPDRPNSLEAVKVLVENKADVNIRNKFGQTAMHLLIGARTSNIDDTYEIEEYLLANGASISIQDENGRLPLHYAFVVNDDWTDTSFMDPIELVTLLVKGKEHDLINTADCLGQTGLHKAAMRGATVCCKLLLGSIRNIDASDKNGNTPLALAVHYGHRYCTLKLLESGANFTLPLALPTEDVTGDSSRKSTILQEVIRQDWLEVLHLMLEQLESLGNGSLAAIEAAISVGRLKLACKLISRLKVAKPSSTKQKTLFHVLCDLVAPGIDEQSQLKIVQLLISKGIDVGVIDQHKSSPIIYAAANLNSFLCRELTKVLGEALVAKMEPDTLLRTPLTSVFWNITEEDIPAGMVSWCSDLLSNGADINAFSHYPVFEVIHDAVSFVDPNRVYRGPSARKYTPLIMAVIKGNYGLVKYLLQHKADINFPDDTGRTPLMHAAALNDIKMIKLLLNPRYDPEKDPKPWNSRFLTFTKTSNVVLDKKDSNGWTVVHHLIAAPPHFIKSSREVTLRLLFRVEAPLDIPDNKGTTPYQMAAQLGHKDVTDTLQELMKVSK